MSNPIYISWVFLFFFLFHVIILKFVDVFSKGAICVILSIFDSCQNHYQGNIYAICKLKFFMDIKWIIISFLLLLLKWGLFLSQKWCLASRISFFLDNSIRWNKYKICSIFCDMDCSSYFKHFKLLSLVSKLYIYIYIYTPLPPWGWVLWRRRNRVANSAYWKPLRRWIEVSGTVERMYVNNSNFDS